MKLRAWTVALALASTTVLGQEYPIANPSQASSAPVHLTRPAEGAVEVTNLPPVQDVRIVGGKPEEPLEVKGEVGLRLTAPIPVEITNPQKGGGEVQVLGPLRLDDSQPLRVWVENPWSPENPAAPEFMAFAYQSRFLPTDARPRRTFSARPGKIFYLTDLVADVRPDTALKIRVLATSTRAVGGSLAGVEFAEFPVAVLDTRRASSMRLATPVPLVGDFTVEVEVFGAAQGGYFSAMTMGYLLSKP